MSFVNFIKITKLWYLKLYVIIIPSIVRIKQDTLDYYTFEQWPTNKNAYPTTIKHVQNRKKILLLKRKQKKKKKKPKYITGHDSCAWNPGLILLMPSTTTYSIKQGCIYAVTSAIRCRRPSWWPTFEKGSTYNTSWI